MKEKIKKQPVVVILGHIDHGKTSLLNAIRKLKFTEQKPGGEITQHLGAFEIEKEGKKITFLDTPGHEAFSQMRSRGAKVADIAVLVVDCVEGPKEQTREAIKYIQKANLPLIVAFTKIDKLQRDPNLAKQELAREGILLESLGGKIPEVKTSAKTGQGIDDLLDLIFLLWEMEGKEVNLEKRAQGVIIEAFLDPKRGPSATVLLEEGKLKFGDFLATESTFGKVRILENFLGEKIEKLLPGQPGLILGFEEVPIVGEKFFTFPSLKEAKEFARKSKREEKEEEIFPEKDQKVLNLILKTDVLGTKEAVKEILKKIPQEKVLIKIIKAGVGEISIEDVDLAKSTKSIIVGFRTKLPPTVKNLAERYNISIFIFNVIYDLVEGMRKLINRMLEPEIERKDLAKLLVLVEFWKKGQRQIIGAKVLEGEVKKEVKFEILRKGEIVGKGKILNLQKEKKDIPFAKKGEEIGLLVEASEKIKEEDEILVFVEEKRKIEI